MHHPLQSIPPRGLSFLIQVVPSPSPLSWASWVEEDLQSKGKVYTKPRLGHGYELGPLQMRPPLELWVLSEWCLRLRLTCPRLHPGLWTFAFQGTLVTEHQRGMVSGHRMGGPEFLAGLYTVLPILDEELSNPK